MKRPTRSLPAMALMLALALPALPVRAADTPEPPPAPAARAPVDRLAPARKLIAEQKWSAAIAELQRVNAGGSADWNNLMGYSHRKLATPDLAAAQRYYDEALRIDPKHAGALEYAGELSLMKGDLAGAETRLATLSGLCRSPCEPLDDLKQAIARFKANGNRFVP